MKVLIVDDIAYSRHSLARVLQRERHTVVAAESGTEALSMLNTDHAIDAVVTDLMMGDMDGVDFFLKAKQLERINDDGTVPAPPFILLTALQPGRPGTNSSTAYRLEIAEQVGFSAILFKPIDQNALRAALQNVSREGSHSSVDVKPVLQQLEQVIQEVFASSDVQSAGHLLACLEKQADQLQQFAAATSETV
jgi:CheY-like chemotaxis protein